MASAVELDPAPFTAVIVYVASAVTRVGVPEIPQSEASVSPVGRAGLEAHEVMGPPELVTVRGVIAEFFVNVTEAEL
jgi:hypothetical protein